MLITPERPEPIRTGGLPPFVHDDASDADREFDRLIAGLRDSLLGQQPSIPLGGVFRQSMAGTEIQRLPGGRADVATPLQAVTPPQFSYMQPTIMAPWLPGVDVEDERRRRVFAE